MRCPTRYNPPASWFMNRSNSPTAVFIVGAGGHGRVISDLARQLHLPVVGFLDDDKSLHGRTVEDLPVVGGFDALTEISRREPRSAVLLGVGRNDVRARLYNEVRAIGVAVLSAIHPSAIVSRRTRIGEGTVIMPGAIVNIGTTVGCNVCINTGATIDHDNVLEDHVHIYPGARLVGGVKVGCFSYISTGAIVGPSVTIGENVTVAAGAVVLHDVPDHVLVGGTPAKILKHKSPPLLGALS